MHRPSARLNLDQARCDSASTVSTSIRPLGKSNQKHQYPNPTDLPDLLIQRVAESVCTRRGDLSAVARVREPNCRIYETEFTMRPR